MATNKGEVNLNKDVEDQEELDRAYNEMMGITGESEENVKSGGQEDVAEADVDNLESGDDTQNDEDLNHDLDSLDDGDNSQDQESYDDADNELEEELDTLDESETNHKEGRVKLDPDAQKVVDKRISRELKRLRDSQKETAELRAQVQMLTQLMTGGNNSQVQPQAYIPQAQFVPPQPAKPYEDMSEFEKVGYAIQVHQARQDAALKEAAMQQEQEAKEYEYRKVVNSLKNYKSDPVINKVLHTGDHDFVKPGIIALSDYKNAPSIVKNLHLTKRSELARLKGLPPEKIAAGYVRLAEQYISQRKQEYSKKLTAKKPTPAGRLNKASLPNKTAGNKDIYSSDYLEGLTNEQYEKLMKLGR